MMMIRWYRSFVRSKLSPMPSMPAPRAMISGRTFSLATILSRRAFSTLRTLPRRGRIALLAVGELAREGEAVEDALANDEVARLACSLASAGRGEAFLDDPAAV